MEYEKLYAQMVEAAEQAIAAIERADYGQAKHERPAGCTGFTAIFGEFLCTERLPRRGFAEKRLICPAWH